MPSPTKLLSDDELLSMVARARGDVEKATKTLDDLIALAYRERSGSITIKRLCEAAGYSEETTRNRLRAAGVPIRPRGNRARRSAAAT